MKRIIITTYFDATLPGGGGLYSIDVTRVWLKQGHNVHIICTDYKRRLLDLLPYFESGQLQLHTICDSAQSMCFQNVFDEKVYSSSKKIISEIKPESIHIHNFHGLLGAVWASVESTYPTIYTALDFGLVCLNGYLFDGGLTQCSGPEGEKCRLCLLKNFKGFWRSKIISLFPKKIYGLLRSEGNLNYHKNMCKTKNYFNDAPLHLKRMLPLLKLFSAVIAPSPIMAEILSKYGVSSERIHNNVYGISPLKKIINDNAKLLNGNNSGKVRLSFLGHTARIKGLPVVAEAVSKLPDGLNIEILIYGEDSSFVKRSGKAAMRYLKNGGLLVGEEVTNALIRSDALIIPSVWYENSPFVVLESLSVGRPVIGSNQPGISNLIKDGYNGFLVSSGDVSAWTKILLKVAEHPEVLRDMRRSCVYDKTTIEFCKELDDIISALI